MGYGNIAKELIKRFKQDGHEVILASKHHLGGSLIVDGITCYDGQEIGLTNVIAQSEKYDYIISCMDSWVLPPKAFHNWVNIIFLDTEFIHPKMIQSFEGNLYQICVTQHAKRELERIGYKPLYAPLGVDTKVFRPDEEIRKKFREKKKWNDNTFVIGSVGINYKTDRKNYIGLIKAFQAFHKRHPDSILYLHTDIMGSANEGLPLVWIAQSAGFREGDAIQWVDQKAYHLWNIAQEEVVATYNGIDVFCLPTLGEGFGIPIIEAQSCGCPVIITDTTSGKELTKSGWLIPVGDDDFEFSTLMTWYARVRPSTIDEYLELAYQSWKDGETQELKEKARNEMLEYDWDAVYGKYWKPILQILENRETLTNIEFRDFPDYDKIYEKLTGKLSLITECRNMCDISSCNSHKYPTLPGESFGQSHPVLLRSYPIFPTKEGELRIYTDCPFYTCVGPRFKNEVKETWDKLFGYPKIREFISNLWNEGFFNSSSIALEDLKPEFNSEYADTMQKIFKTTFTINDKVSKFIEGSKTFLDVGCGDGRRIKELNEKGFNAIGVEINEYWVDNKIVYYGDTENIPFENDSFDAAFSIDVLEHLKNPLKGISELFRVSKNKVIISITSTEDGSFGEDTTHIVFWDLNRWAREIAEFGTIVDVFNKTFLVNKKK